MESPVSVDLSDSANELVKNLAGPTTKTIGQTIGDLLFLCLGGISQAAEIRRMKYANSLAMFEANLKAKVDSIPEEKLVEPDTQKILSALDDAKYCVEHDELRILFENLIASSLSSDTAGFVHPAFSQIIRRLSVLDANLIALFVSSQAYPLVEYRIYFKQNSYRVQQSNVLLVDVSSATYEEKAASLLCLSSLGLVKISYMEHFSNVEVYEPFKNTVIYHELQTMMDMNEALKKISDNTHFPDLIERIDMGKGRVDITEFGYKFLKSCGYVINRPPQH